MQDQHIFLVNPIEDHILTNRKTPQTRSQVRIATATDVWVFGNEKETFSQRIDEPVSDLETSARARDIHPDPVQFIIGFRRHTMRH